MTFHTKTKTISEYEFNNRLHATAN